MNTTRAHPITTGGAALCVAAAAEAPLRRALLEGHGAPGVPGGCPAGTWAQHPTGFKELVQGGKACTVVPTKKWIQWLQRCKHQSNG